VIGTKSSFILQMKSWIWEHFNRSRSEGAGKRTQEDGVVRRQEVARRGTSG
jgi:hypothetical protein